MGDALEIRMQQYGYDCGLCGTPVFPAEDGAYCLMLRGTGGGVCVCKACHDAAPADGVIDP